MIQRVPKLFGLDNRETGWNDFYTIEESSIRLSHRNNDSVTGEPTRYRYLLTVGSPVVTSVIHVVTPLKGGDQPVS